MQWLRCYCLCLLLPFHALRAEPLQLVDTLASLQPRAGQTPQAEAQILQLILQQYPSPYTLVDISRNRAREWTKSAGNACIPWLRKTPERARDYLFTLPYMLESAITLVSLPQSRWQTQLEQLQDAQGKISLKQLLELKRPPSVLSSIAVMATNSMPSCNNIRAIQPFIPAAALVNLSAVCCQCYTKALLT